MPTDDEIEAAAKLSHRRDMPSRSWENADPRLQAIYRHEVRPLLEVAERVRANANQTGGDSE